MKNPNKMLKSMIIIFIAFVVLFFAYSIINTNPEQQHKIFSDIDSLDVLTPYIVEEINDDSFLRDLKPIEKFCNKIEWNNKIFYVFAYVFENDSQCMQYTSNREMSYYGTKSFNLKSNIYSNSKYIICAGNNLMYIDGPGENALMDFLDFIGQDFDIVL